MHMRKKPESPAPIAATRIAKTSLHIDGEVYIRALNYKASLRRLPARAGRNAMGLIVPKHSISTSSGKGSERNAKPRPGKRPHLSTDISLEGRDTQTPTHGPSPTMTVARGRNRRNTGSRRTGRRSASCAHAWRTRTAASSLARPPSVFPSRIWRPSSRTTTHQPQEEQEAAAPAPRAPRESFGGSRGRHRRRPHRESHHIPARGRRGQRDHQPRTDRLEACIQSSGRAKDQPRSVPYIDMLGRGQHPKGLLRGGPAPGNPAAPEGPFATRGHRRLHNRVAGPLRHPDASLVTRGLREGWLRMERGERRAGRGAVPARRRSPPARRARGSEGSGGPHQRRKGMIIPWCFHSNNGTRRLRASGRTGTRRA